MSAARRLTVLAVLAGAALCACATHRVPTAAAPIAAPAAGPERFGIEIVGVRTSAAGSLLDVRYRIVDSAKAAYVTDRRQKPFLVHAASGARLGIPSGPTVGPMRQTLRAGEPPAGSVLFILFANPDRRVQKGDDVTLVIGELRADHLTVQ